MSTLWHDILYALRILFKRPTLTAVALITLVFGIGLNVAVFSIVDGVLIRTVPFPDPDNLIFVGYYHNGSLDTISGPDFVDWENQNQVFENLSAFRDTDLNLTGTGHPANIKTWKVTSNFFSTLGVQPILGRSFLPEECTQGNNQVVILGHDLWQQHFGADPHIIGSQITLDAEPHTVVGISPPNQGVIGQMTQAMVPLLRQDLTQNRGSHAYLAIGRLKTGTSLQQAQADMETIFSRLEREYPRTNTNTKVKLMPLQKILVREAGAILWILYAAVGLVLLVACVNVASILLAQSEVRKPEMAVRRALGAGRLQIIRQILIESLILSVTGGVTGLLLGGWAVKGLKALLPGELFGGITLFEKVGLHPGVFGFACAISILAGILFGIIPAWRLSRPNLIETLKKGTSSSHGSSRRHGLLSMFVTTQIASAMVLLVGAGLLTKSFYQFSRMNPGFNSRQLLAVELQLPQYQQYQSHQQRLNFCNQLQQRIGTIEGVRSVDLINMRPLNIWKSFQGFRIEGHEPLQPGQHLEAEYRQVSYGYFSTMHIPLHQGRLLQTTDNGTNPVMIINEAFASRFFPDENPLGKHILFRGRTLGIVGVVGNIKSRSMSLNLVEYPPMMYEPITQACDHKWTIMVRTAGSPMALIEPIRQQLWQVDSDQPVAKVNTMEDILYESMALQSIGAIMMGIMAAGALLLAVIGVYGLSSYASNQRHREFGIRLALGAQKTNIQWLAMKKTMILILAGGMLGLIAALAVARILCGVLYNVSSTDPVIFACVILLLAGSAALGSHLPARRAAKTSPMEVLRYE